MFSSERGAAMAARAAGCSVAEESEEWGEGVKVGTPSTCAVCE